MKLGPRAADDTPLHSQSVFDVPIQGAKHTEAEASRADIERKIQGFQYTTDDLH